MPLLLLCVGAQKWRWGGPVPLPTPCLYLIYKYRDVYMVALALSVFPDAAPPTVPPTVAAGEQTRQPSHFPAVAFPAPMTFDSLAGMWEWKEPQTPGRVGSIFPLVTVLSPL